MSQNAIQVVANPTTGTLPGASLVSQTNAALDSLARLFSGPAAPTAAGLGLSSLAGVSWHDTTNNLLKLRDQADGAWITLGAVDETDKLFSAALRTDGSLRQSGGVVQANNPVTSTAVAVTLAVASPASSGNEAASALAATPPAR